MFIFLVGHYIMSLLSHTLLLGFHSFQLPWLPMRANLPIPFCPLSSFSLLPCSFHCILFSFLSLIQSALVSSTFFNFLLSSICSDFALIQQGQMENIFRARNNFRRVSGHDDRPKSFQLGHVPFLADQIKTGAHGVIYFQKSCCLELIAL